MSHTDGALGEARTWTAAHADCLRGAADAFPRSSRQFVLFVAADAAGVPDAELHDCVVRLLEAGARTVCTWGPDCERVHDAFDGAAGELGLNRDDAVVMTTWHDDESLTEALWFAAHATPADEAYLDAYDSVVAVSIGSRAWYEEIRSYLEAGAPLPEADEVD